MAYKDFISSHIKELRIHRLGLTAEQLANLLEPPRSSKTISSWECGRTEPDADTLIQLCKIFDVPISSMYPTENMPKGEGEADYPYVEVPLYGSIAAGRPLAIIPVENTHPIPVEMHQKHPKGFLLKVEGESMNNILPNGSYALIDPEQTHPETNKPYALCVNGNDATIKRIKKLANGYELLPDSKDPTYKSTIYDYAQEDPDELIIIGQVVWMMLPFDWEM